MNGHNKNPTRETGNLSEAERINKKRILVFIKNAIDNGWITDLEVSHMEGKMDGLTELNGSGLGNWMFTFQVPCDLPWMSRVNGKSKE